VSQLKLASESGSVFDPATQGEFRDQIKVINDALRQLAGNGVLAPGDTTINDPLNAPYILHVNPYTGRDTFAAGSYASRDDDDFDSKMRRIELQRLTCGYTAASPFRTINRAVIEAAIITSKTWFTIPNICGDLISIVLYPGVHRVLNGLGSSGNAVVPWPDGYEPTDADLTGFNPSGTGGILLPRGLSLCGYDLRKVIIEPQFVPAVADEQSSYDELTNTVSYPNRRQIFKTTGNGYYFGFTFIDKQDVASSHHLLSCWGHASQAELNEFYGKVNTAVGGAGNPGNVNPSLLAARPSEYQLVGPQPPINPTVLTDTTGSSSAYIFNCSIRSNYGLGGCHFDGAKPVGFKSTVMAQFTGVSLQRDITCWEIYDTEQADGWRQPVNYDELVSAAVDPDSIRFNTKRRSFHIRCINEAFAQEVSVFAIGQAVHHATETGGELTITNSNSNFGGVSALSTGYKLNPFPLDEDWNIAAIRVATDLSDQTGNVRRVVIGTVHEDTANDATTLKLVLPLQDSSRVPGVPDVLARDNYSFKPDTYLWVDNPQGNDFRALLTNAAWDPAEPDQIVVQAGGFKNQDNQVPGQEVQVGSGPGTITSTLPDLAGKTVYVRRLVDTRAPEQRRYGLRLVNTTPTRTPVRDFVIQVDTSQSQMITRRLPVASPLLVTTAAKIESTSGTAFEAIASIRRGAGGDLWVAGALYRVGDNVRANNKHHVCIEEHVSVAAFDPTKWSEAFVHMQTDFRPEDNPTNEGPIIVFDGDTDDKDGTATCGYDLSIAWGLEEIQLQYRSSSDYRGVYTLLEQLGFEEDDIKTILYPLPIDYRELNPVNPLYGIDIPAGAAIAWGNWPLQFHRPSVIRLYSHAWEWAGFGNYTRALPQYQGEMSPRNKFSYFFTNDGGGRVYGTGNNEDGFSISPFGITDISTGQQISLDQIGQTNDENNLTFPTNFGDITVSSIVISGLADFGSSADFTGTNLIGFPAAGVTSLDKNGNRVGRDGIVRLATGEEVDNAFNSGTLPPPPSVPGPPGRPPVPTGTEYAVPLFAMSNLKAAVLSEIRLLEKRYTRIYIDGTVGRATWDAALDIDSVPEAIWTDILYNSNRIHEIAAGWPISNPSGDAKNIASKLVFKSLDQAMRFVDNRSPIGTDRITFYFYNTSTVNGPIGYSGVASLNFQRGPSQLVDSNGRAPIIFFNNRWISVSNPNYVSLTDLNITNRGSATETARKGTAVLVDAGGPNITVGTITTWNCRLESFFISNAQQSMIRGNFWGVFSKPFWDGPGTGPTNCNMEFIFNSSGEDNGVVTNWNSLFWGQKVQVFARRGPDNLETPYVSGERSFKLTLTDIYSTATGAPTGRKPFIVFKSFQSFQYVSGAYNPDTTENLFGMPWTIDMVDYNGGGIYFIQPHIPTAPFNLKFDESLTNGGWPNPDKNTTVSITRSGGIVPPYFRFCQFRQGSTDGVNLSSFLNGSETTVPLPADFTSLINRWGKEVRRFLESESSITTPRTKYLDTLLEFAPGTLFNNDFRFFNPPPTVVSGSIGQTYKVDLYSANTDSGAGSGALAWADSSVTTFADESVVDVAAFAVEDELLDPYQPGLPPETDTIYLNQPDELINPPQPIGGAS
jgi:hypothetical protein